MRSRKESRQATSEKVTAAAQRLFLEQGFTATTIRDIAAAAGVSVGSVMTVGDKSALLIAMFDGSIAQIHHSRSGLSPADIGGGTGDDAADRIIEILTPFLDIFATHMELAREYAAILMSGRHSSVIFNELATILTTEIERTLHEYGLNPTDVPGAARTIYLSYLGTLFVWAGSGMADDTEPLRNLRTVLAYVTRSEDT